MEVVQIADLVNQALTDSLGGQEVSGAPDLSNVVYVGDTFDKLVSEKIYEKFTGALVNHIGKLIVVNRAYTGNAPSIMMDSWLYGSILEKIGSEMPEVTKNDSWELVDKQSYDPHIYHSAKAYAKFFNKMTTFEIDRSILDRQIRQSFSNATQLNAFISMLFNEVQKALTVANEQLIYETMGNLMAVTIKNKDTKPAMAVNLLEGYNAISGDTLTAEKAIYTPAFIRYAALQMKLYMKKMSALTTMFNQGGKQRFTPDSLLHVVSLNEFMQAADIYLQSDTYHDEYTRLVRGDVVPYWQAPGADFDFTSASSIKYTPILDDGTHAAEVSQSGILFVMFDRDACGVANFDQRVTTAYNPKAEFTNYFYKQDARYFNDFNEQCVVFYVADAE